ncbi:alkylated DNA nucleotide flippase Atl1 [Streptosporangium becharense]|uniref:Alkylated DNA nucleotide flippase Atl1 n=1 Tax=Streptosporangium becharense TaxID=1816182 RepID=A0A7W9IIA3_9ACTN|nr:MGMT family protein [Streptosporangium becharense]MBB2913545.1 alkylated DNA nucleotide flippase Atl1 [Streptosporangium becharense]MBB5821235.1 alkylated DNA nucleotide flippase Atl1 [Streptosporangium becharense]
MEPVGHPTPYAERVLDLVECIPPGKVMSYGDIAEYLQEGGPRQVGRAMSVWGGGVPWWRVVHADGTPPPGHEQRCLTLWRQEGTPLRGTRVDMHAARWDGTP